MKTTVLLLALTAFAGASFAQLNPLPPSSVVDLVTPQSIGVNAGATHWDANPGLASYKFASDGTLGVPKPGSPDNVLGLNWASSSAEVVDLLNQTNIYGGIVRAIFLGESARWLNDFGYTYSGNPQGPHSFTVYQNIQAMGPTPVYGSYIDISLGAGAASTFDFWLNGVGGDGLVNPVPPTTNGGVYTVFHPANSNPYNAPGNVMMTTTALMVNTYIGATGTYQNKPAYLVAIEDWRLDCGCDQDNNDFMFALQFFKPDGRPCLCGAVPEPSSYGLFGVAILISLIALRRTKSKCVR
jgi:hypothetical protein